MDEELTNKESTMVVLPFGKVKDERSNDKKAAFDGFTKEIFGADGVEKDSAQFIQLISTLLEYVETNKLLGQEEFIAFDKALASFKDKISAGEELAINTKSLFEILCFHIMKNNDIEKEIKVECLIGLTDPLLKCVEGAQGEMQSRIMTLNATSLAEQLSAFAKSLLEDSAYKAVTNKGYKLDSAIHTRNNFLMAAYNMGVKVIGEQPFDQYSGDLKLNQVESLICDTIDKSYTVNEFLDSICTTMSAYIADLNLRITEKYKLEKLYKFSEYYGLDEKAVSVMLGFKCEMPYSEMSNLLQKIYLRDSEADDKKINFKYVDGNNLITEPMGENILLIRINNGAVTFTINENTNSIISQNQHPELFDEFVALLENKPDIEDIANLLISDKCLNSPAFREFDTDFFRYKVLKTMSAQGLLSEKPANYSNSIFLNKTSNIILQNNHLSQSKLTDYTHIVASNPDYSCVILPLETGLGVFVEKNGEYLKLSDACKVDGVKDAIKEQLQILAGSGSPNIINALMPLFVKNKFETVFNTDMSMRYSNLGERVKSCRNISDCVAILFNHENLDDEQKLYNTLAIEFMCQHVEKLTRSERRVYLQVNPSESASTIEQLRILYAATAQRPDIIGRVFVEILEKTPLAYDILGSEKEFTQDLKLWGFLKKNLEGMNFSNSLRLLQLNEVPLDFRSALAERLMDIADYKNFGQLTDILTEDNNKNLLQNLLKELNVPTYHYLETLNKTYLPKFKFEQALAFLVSDGKKYNKQNNIIINHLLDSKLRTLSSPLNNVPLEFRFTTLVQEHIEPFFIWFTYNYNHKIFKDVSLVKIIIGSQKFKDALNANIYLIQFLKTHKNIFTTYKDWINLMQLENKNNRKVNLALVSLMLQNADVSNKDEVEGIIKFFITNSNLSENIVSADRKLLENFKYKLQRYIKPNVIDRINLFRKKITDNSEKLDFYIQVIDKLLNPGGEPNSKPLLFHVDKAPAKEEPRNDVSKGSGPKI